MSSPIVKSHESGSIAAGAVINIPVHRVAECDEVDIFVDNSDPASVARALTINFLAEDGVSVLFAATVNVALGTRAAVVIGSKASPVAAPPTGVTFLQFSPSPFISASLAAGGTKAAQVAMYAR